MSPVVEARGLRKTYAGDDTPVDALRGVDVAVEPGELVAVMGPSGCGKSTLLHVLGALARPSSGDVLIDGSPVWAMSDDERAGVRARSIGFVFQLFNLVAVLSVEENVALPAVIAGERERDYRLRVDELLERVGLAHRRGKVPSQLSGGEQQRVAIARALVMDPRIMLADEPTGNLDSRSGSEILSLFRNLHEAGQTVLVVTHDVKVASHARRVLHMRDGLVVREERLEGHRLSDFIPADDEDASTA